MEEPKPVDRILNEARKEAVEKAFLPPTLKKTVKVAIENGRVVVAEKKK